MAKENQKTSIAQSTGPKYIGPPVDSTINPKTGAVIIVLDPTDVGKQLQMSNDNVHNVQQWLQSLKNGNLTNTQQVINQMEDSQAVAVANWENVCLNGTDTQINQCWVNVLTINALIQKAQDIANGSVPITTPINEVIWGSDFDAIKVIDIQQGKDGDCFFVSSINAIIASGHADTFKKMITPIGSDTYAVQFPKYKDNPIIVPMTVQEAAQLSNKSQLGGIWLAILGAAADQVKAGPASINTESTDPFQSIDKGGKDWKVLDLLTGVAYDNVDLAGAPSSDLVDIISSLMESAVKNGELSQAIGLNTPKHALCITQYYPVGTPLPTYANYQAGVTKAQAKGGSVGTSGSAVAPIGGPYVTIQNPWGTSEPYNAWRDHRGDDKGLKAKKADDSNNWVYMMSGSFTVAASELVELGYVSIQVPKSKYTTYLGTLKKDNTAVTKALNHVTADNNEIQGLNTQIKQDQNLVSNTGIGDKQLISNAQAQITKDQKKTKNLNEKLSKDFTKYQNAQSTFDQELNDPGKVQAEPKKVKKKQSGCHSS